MKTRLTITASDLDTILERLIDSCSQFIEKQTNRVFKEATYTEYYSPYGAGRDMVFLKNAPVSSITSVAWKAGLPGSPNYTLFTTNDYELIGDGKEGMVKIYGVIPNEINALKIIYTAGYKIDFANEGTATHTLPFDVTELCEKLVVRKFKRRELGGKSSENLQGGSINWQDELDKEDIMTLNAYTQPPRIV